MKTKKPKLKNKLNFIKLGIAFSLLYWLLESWRDVFVFEKGNLFQRVFYPDPMSFWMRILIVMFLILFGIHLQSMKLKTLTKRSGMEILSRVNGIIWAGLLFCTAYWIMEAVRDVIVFNKGNILKCIFAPDPLALWMRLMAVFVIFLFSVYAQSHVNKRKLVEEELRKEREELEKIIAERTSELVESNRLLKEEIEERNKTEEEKRMIREQLFQAQKMEAIGTLAGGIAHDFNNLLTAIIGCVDLSLDEVDETDVIYGDLKEIQTAAQRAADLTKQLLLFSRKKPIKVNPVNMNRIIQDLLTMLKRLIGEDIHVQTHLESNLWMIKADQGTLEQVIVNLAVNARDAMPDGGEIIIKTKNITITEADKVNIPEAPLGKCIRISVSDKGTGMDEITIQHIYDPFFSTKAIGKGTGLGLSVAYGIITQHGGCMHVESEINRGTTFEIYLPALNQKKKEKTKGMVSKKKHQGKNQRILVVEDEEKVREFTTSGLSRSGYIVFSAADAQEAVDIFKRENGNFDVVISDVVLPGKSGIELANGFCTQKPNIGILLSSGYTDYQSRWPIIQENGYQFLEKPYTLNDLIEVIRKLAA